MDLRDARNAFLRGGLGIGLLVVATASQIAVEFGTPAARATMAALPSQLPAMFRGLIGDPIDIGKLGAFLSWRTLNFSSLILGMWSAIALSRTLAGEGARGALDVILATPRSRAGIATQKFAAHAAAMAIAVGVIGVMTWWATHVFATLPGDEVSLASAGEHMIWLGLAALVPGALAWAMAPIVGRGAAVGTGAFAMIASYVVHGYRDAVPAFEQLAPLSYFYLTRAHRPLAGQMDWRSVAILAAIVLGLFALGLAAFQRRDVGITIKSRFALPRTRLGLGGPLGRSFADRLAPCFWMGVGLGGLGALFAGSADSFAEAMRSIPQIQHMVGRIFPNVDLFSAGAMLQLVFFEMGTLFVVALAGAVAGGWASDEQEKRLDVVLSTPVSRFGWAWRSALGALAAIAAFALITGALLAAATYRQGDSPAGPFVGALVLGAYTASLVGTGIAAGGLARPGLAGATATGLGLAFYLLDVFGDALNLPQWMVDVALTNHLGQPMAGSVNWSGLAAVVLLAIGGVLLGAWGLTRRDLS